MAGAIVLNMGISTFLSIHGNKIQTIMNVKNHYQPMCFIIPEYMNKRIVEKGTDKQKDRAWKNLILTEHTSWQETGYCADVCYVFKVR